jgi:hypothetical protein
MKILYITNHIQIAQQSGGYLNDYLNDLLFHGFTELDDIEVVDSTPIIHLYKENDFMSYHFDTNFSSWEVFDFKGRKVQSSETENEILKHLKLKLDE